MSTRQRRKDARPQELLDAALSLFVEKGFAATKAEEVAALAGVSKGTLYLYYPSKEDLLRAVIRHNLSTEIAAGAQELARMGGPAGDRLQRVVADWWERILASPTSGVFKLVITELRNFPEIARFYAEEVVMPGTQLVESLIREGVASGEFADVNVQQAALSVLLPMVMLCLHKHSLGACGLGDPALEQPELFIRQHLALVVNGLRRGPARL
ncbi:TetR/AcrR family transcriptional regulator [Ideonella livida]|uniref:TetR/AcrR family transcriptional regulator n=1 Tax=Ideonella livida TaxID=2707176 RepID=UPI0028739D39|nr:TetR/AcrR family transcriptional regulator [Ideonella livida]